MTFSINIFDFKIQQLAAPQAASINKAKHGAVLYIYLGLKYGFYLFPAQHTGQLVFTPGPFQRSHIEPGVQHLPVEKLQGIDNLILLRKAKPFGNYVLVHIGHYIVTPYSIRRPIAQPAQKTL